MSRISVYLLLVLFFLANISCNGKSQLIEKVSLDSSNKACNIIFLIGDGMGLSQLSSAYFYSESEPNFSRFPVIGLSKTRSG